MHVKIQIARHKVGRAYAQNIQMAALHQQVDHLVELFAVRLVHHHPQLVHIRLHHRRQQILAGEHVPRLLDALRGGQAAADHLLQGPLHAGIAVIAQFRGKTDHRGFADAHQTAQLAGGHEGGLVVIFQDVVADPLLSLGEAAHIGLNDM